MAKSIGKEEMRKMMQKLKTEKLGSAAATSTNKKYKLSSRELALMEEQKNRERREKEKKIAEKRKFDGQKLPEAPKRGILKNSSAPPTQGILKNSTATPVQTSSYVPKPAAEAVVNKAGVPSDFFDSKKVSNSEVKKAKIEETRADSAKSAEKAENGEPSSSSAAEPLPEGFFDDPVQDAKARNIVYKDPTDEEWEKFQKEIGVAQETAQEKISEEQHTSTIDRQLDEIDDQMRAWSK